MQTSELYINDTPLDLPADSLIALTYAVNTLTDLKSVQGSISNSISLPDTANNRRALGYPEDLNFNGATVIRQKQPCRYLQNGVEVVPLGNLRIVGASKGVLKVVMSCGNTDFFDLLTGKLRDLDMSEYDHVWNIGNVIASRLNTAGYLYPIVNYGNLINDNGHENGTAIFPRDMRPAVFVSYICRKIVESAGYTLNDAPILADPVTAPIYSNMLLPFSDDKLVHPQRYADLYSLQNLEARNQTLTTFNTNRGQAVNMAFPVTVTGTTTNFDGTNWTAGALMSVNASLTFQNVRILRRSGQSDDGCYLNLVLKQLQPGGGYTFTQLAQSQCAFGSVTDKTFYNVVVAAQNILVNPGDELYCEVDTGGTGGGTTVMIYPDAIFTVTVATDNVNYGEEVQIEGALPDMTTTDFLKFIQFYFCCIIQTDNVALTVTLVPFGHIIQNLPQSVDWSGKVTNNGEDYDVQVGDYCQQNEAKWKHDDTLSPDTYANGSFYLTDQNLDLYQDVYDLPFAASMETTWQNAFRTIFVNKIPDITVANQMVTQTEQRVCLLNKISGSINYKDVNGGPITTITDNIPLTYFSSGSPYVADLTLPSIFANHYPDLVNVLNDQRKLTCYLRLTEMDIQTLDFFKPVYISKFASYFYISKITDFTGVKPCKVELIRL